jgi:DNA polymerase-3 subunit beta
MKALMERHQLNGALRKLATGAGTVAPLIMTASSHRIELVAIGREAIIQADIDAEVQEPGAAEFNVKQTASVVKSLPNGKVGVESDPQGIAFRGGDAKVVLAEQDELCGVELPEPREDGESVDGELIRTALEAVIPAAATDNHPIFGSVRFDESAETMRLVASDTFRLAVRDLPGIPSPGMFSVHARVLKRMVRALGKTPVYRVGFSDGYVWFASRDEVVMWIVCSQSDYPRYRGWSPPWEARVGCARGPLLDLVKRVVALDRKAPAAAKLEFSEAGIDFAAKSPAGMVSGSLPADLVGLPEPVTLRFNSLFLADALTNLISDQVEIRLAEDPLARPKPVRISDPAHPEAWNLVMPMRAG